MPCLLVSSVWEKLWWLIGDTFFVPGDPTSISSPDIFRNEHWEHK